MLLKGQQFYERQIAEKSHWLLFWVVCVLLILGYQTRHFALDAARTANKTAQKAK